MTDKDKHGRPVLTMIGSAGLIVVTADQRKQLEAQGYEVVVKHVAKKRKPKKAKKSEE